MRLLSRLARSTRSPGRHHRPSGPLAPGVYRSAAYATIRPWQVRRRRFRSVGLLRRGLDPTDVQEFLRQVADDLGMVYAELHRSREETCRIKEALRRWQSEYAPRVNERAYH